MRPSTKKKSTKATSTRTTSTRAASTRADPVLRLLIVRVPVPLRVRELRRAFVGHVAVAVAVKDNVAVNDNDNDHDNVHGASEALHGGRGR